MYHFCIQVNAAVMYEQLMAAIPESNFSLQSYRKIKKAFPPLKITELDFLCDTFSSFRNKRVYTIYFLGKEDNLLLTNPHNTL